MADKADQPDDMTQDSQGAQGQDDPLEVRPARPEDRDAVLAFCAHTWDDGD